MRQSPEAHRLFIEKVRDIAALYLHPPRSAPKALAILAAGGEVDYVGASVELVGTGDRTLPLITVPARVGTQPATQAGALGVALAKLGALPCQLRPAHAPTSLKAGVAAPGTVGGRGCFSAPAAVLTGDHPTALHCTVPPWTRDKK